MPQSVTIDLPLIITDRGGLSLVRPIGFPEYALASSKPDNAIHNVQRRVLKDCREYVGADLVNRMVRGLVQQSRVSVEIVPEKRKMHDWREPIEIILDTFVWTQGNSLVITYIPNLDLTVVASPGTAVDKLVEEQIRSAIRRQDAWSLAGLASLHCSDGASLSTTKLKVQLPTPIELARKQNEEPRESTPTLKAVATRLKRQMLPLAYHRDTEVTMLAQLLDVNQPRSVLLVGPSGVGKTAIFHQWARTRNRWNMQHVQCWSTDGSRLISGQTGFGMWQKQCLAMADEAAKYPMVIHLGNLVELSESGRSRGSGGCGSLLAPRLADGSLVGIIECTSEQLMRMQRIEPRLVAALTTLTIEEPTSEQTRSILLEAAASWRPIDITADLKRKRKKKQRKQQVTSDREPSRQKVAVETQLPTVELESLQVLDRLHRRFQTDAAAPGRPLAFFHAVMSELSPGETLDCARVIKAFGRQSGLPQFLVDDSVRPDLDSIHDQLSSQILGQQRVIGTLVDLIATLAADLSRGDRPLASLMLIGPTGVGKTETAKALARLIYSDVSRLVRIDMSELSTPSAVGRLIGDAVNPEGLLTSAVRAQPFSLVLLDEFEKAHPSVFDLLLQVLGEGRLTDGHGRVADFRNSVVMMTSNLGVETFRTVAMGLADTQQQDRYRNHFERQVREFLRPEMFNRIDRILSYDPLSPETVQQIAKMRIEDVRRRDGWKDRGGQFEIEPDVMRSLARNGYQPQYGARPLAREVERSVVLPLAEAICHSGRVNRLDVNVSVALATTTQPEMQDRIVVQAKARPAKDRRSEDAIIALMNDMTTLRRRGQALDRSQPLRDLRNRYTQSRRTLKKQLRTAKSHEDRDSIQSSIRARHSRMMRDQIKAIDKLCNDLNEAETQLSLRFHFGQPIENETTEKRIKRLRNRLWDTLCLLQSQRPTDNQRISLILTGPNLTLAKPLLEGYAALAVSRGWNLHAHAILPRDNNDTQDRKINAEGWSSEPSFRVMTTRDSVVDDLMDLASNPFGSIVDMTDLEEPVRKPKLAAYGLLQMAQLTSLPSGSLGLMISFSGRAVEMMLSNEVGVHSFYQTSSQQQKRQQKSSRDGVLISKHLDGPFSYVAPGWLPRGEFQVTGYPRRGYDLNKKMVQDLTAGETLTIKMDRDGKWLETLLEQEMERRIWAMLDE